MTQPRKQQVCLEATPYYHCICRCVRRAFLCGDDKVTGQNFDHRKQWLVDKVTLLSSVFAIEICAYSIMSNHYHLVLKVDKVTAEQWSDKEVALRWMQLFNGNILVNRWLKEPNITQAETDKALEVVKEWRNRLYDLGWYMRCLNESIAVRANKEDNCKGRFWEGRFKSQALLDETALLACMAYVDLNPVRAAICDTPENSDFTSVQQRIYSLKQATETLDVQPATLLPFTGYVPHSKTPQGLPFKLFDYLSLVDWTGRCVRDDKRGFIPADIKHLFERLAINEKDWLMVIKEFNRHFISAAGDKEQLALWAQKTNRKWCATHGDMQLYQV
jgi:REP element-mobilizing transposase RayT